MPKRILETQQPCQQIVARCSVLHHSLAVMFRNTSAVMSTELEFQCVRVQVASGAV